MTNAQRKYAVLVGINNYYQEPGVISYLSLKGCVNDVNSMKALFINRFGFNEEKYKNNYGCSRNKKKCGAALMNMANTCQAGDAFVFYFSRHGVWMSDDANITDPIKRGMNQAMVMSDLYSENLSCLFTDALTKKIINKFVDKKVIATTIIDCCFSGYIVMSPPDFTHNYYTYPFIDNTQKSISPDNIDAGFARMDYRLYSELYEANDTVRTRALEYASQHPEDSAARASKVITGIEILTNWLPGHPGEDTAAWIQNFDFKDAVETFTPQQNDSATLTRSYSLKDAIRIFDPEKIPRPSKRPHSQFLSLAGTASRRVTHKKLAHHSLSMRPPM